MTLARSVSSGEISAKCITTSVRSLRGAATRICHPPCQHLLVLVANEGVKIDRVLVGLVRLVLSAIGWEVNTEVYGATAASRQPADGQLERSGVKVRRARRRSAPVRADSKCGAPSTSGCVSPTKRPPRPAEAFGGIRPLSFGLNEFRPGCLGGFQAR